MAKKVYGISDFDVLVVTSINVHWVQVVAFMWYVFVGVESGNASRSSDNSGIAETNIDADDVMNRVVVSREVNIGNKDTVNSLVNTIAKVDGLEKKMNLDIETLKIVASRIDQFKKECE